MGTERELKFSSSADRPPEESELRAALASAGFELGTGSETTIEDHYFDDARLSLSRAGLALRRRNVDGRELATLKTRGSVSGALHEREEIELPVAGAGWPAPILDRLAVVTAPGYLQPHTSISTRRLSYPVLERGRPLAMVAFDAVTARSHGGSREVAFDEVEIEAQERAAPAQLEAVAAAIAELMPLVAKGSSKLERVRELLLIGDW